MSKGLASISSKNVAMDGTDPRGDLVDTDIRSAIASGIIELQSAEACDASEARSEVQILMQHVLNVNRAYLLAHPEQVLTTQAYSHFMSLLHRRAQGEPLAYILGEREFFGLNFKVTPATLIPRPDTELLVELALRHISFPGCRVLDLGTGSGAIAISIAHSRPDAEVIAVDASEAALRVAEENARTLSVSNVGFVQGSWFSALAGKRFDLVVSNPPYIAEKDPHLEQGDLRFEPSSALASGTDGLDDIRCIIRDAGAHLVTGGWLMLEHGYDQAEKVCGLLRGAGFQNVHSENDLAGIARVSAGQLGGRDI